MILMNHQKHYILNIEIFPVNEFSKVNDFKLVWQRFYLYLTPKDPRLFLV